MENDAREASYLRRARSTAAKLVAAIEEARSLQGEYATSASGLDFATYFTDGGDGTITSATPFTNALTQLGAAVSWLDSGTVAKDLHLFKSV
jgi:adenosylcobinamide amidohydrolase